MTIRAENEMTLVRVDDGEEGADGTTFYPSVSSEGVISWTNDGEKPNPEPVVIKGPQGISLNSVTRYYKLSDTTPTDYPPSTGWQTSEPAYTPGDARNLYICDLFAWSNSTVTASEISLSSSYEAAKQAYNAAQGALTAANGKNTIFHQSTQPTGGTYKVGDTWFDTDDGYKMYTYNGSAWVAEQLGANAIADLAITNAKIANGTIQNAKIATVDAGKITTGTMDANRIAANSLTIGKIETTDREQILNSNVQVGGRNLAFYSNSFEPAEMQFNTNTYMSLIEDSDRVFVRFKGTNTSAMMGCYLLTPYTITIENGEVVESSLNEFEFMLSFDYRANNDLTNITGFQLRLFSYNSGTGKYTNGGRLISLANTASFNLSQTTQWKRIENPLKVTKPLRLYNTGTQTGTYTIGIGFVINAGVAFDMSHIKLELGNKPTDWTPAPEDTQQYTDDKVNNIQVGGRNWLQRTGDLSQWYHNTTYVTDDDFNGSEVNFRHGSTLSWNYAIGHNEENLVFKYADVKDKTFTLSFEAKSDAISTGASERMHIALAGCATAGGARTKYGIIGNIYNNLTSTEHLNTTYTKYSVTFTINDASFTSGSGDVNYVFVQFYNYTLSNVSVRNVKMELGNKATDWTPAPEDVNKDITDASKTATNYIMAGPDGLHVTDNTNNVGTSNENAVRIDSDSVDIIKAGQKVAEYSQGLTVWSDNGTEIAHLGYGTTEGESGQTASPYYDLGIRKSGTTKGSYSVAEGDTTTASSVCSHAEGRKTTASGYHSHAEGWNSTASANEAHAEGWSTTASGNDAHAEGEHTIASGSRSHAEGYYTTASGPDSHAEGYYTTASGSRSHAEGWNTTASSLCSHAEGRNTIASGYYSHVRGKYNVKDSDNIYAEIVGNGTDENNRSNAYALDWNGNAYYNGEVYVGCNADSTGRTLSLGTYVTSAILTSDSGTLYFSIPLGRVFPSETTVSKITFNITARASNANGTGYYIMKKTSGGSDTTPFDSSASTVCTFYNASNTKRTPSVKPTLSIQGGTNLYFSWATGTSHYFSGTSTITGYINNNAVTVSLSNIQITLNVPSQS